MAKDFGNFLLIYLILLLMFCLVGNYNFVFSVYEFGSLFDSLMLLIDSSMGNYDFSVCEQIEDDLEEDFCKTFMMVAVIVFTILILNLIIAILSNTYNLFDKQKSGLFLSKILSTRDELEYDDHYSAFISGMSPFNFVLIPFFPAALIMKKNPKLN